jgi:hypothetical protein
MEEEAGNPCRQGSTGGAEQLAHPHGLDVKHLQEYKEQMSWVDAHREKNANGDCNTSSHSVPQCRWYKSAATGDSSKHRPSHEVGKNNNTYQHEQGKTARERTATRNVTQEPHNEKVTADTTSQHHSTHWGSMVGCRLAAECRQQAEQQRCQKEGKTTRQMHHYTAQRRCAKHKY